MKNTFLILLVVFIGLTACKKDEVTEPQVSKDDLLCRTWQLDKEYINGEENQAMINIDYEYKKDGTGTSVLYFGQPITSNFEWRWADNKESIEVMVINSKIKYGWNKANIIVLSENYLVLEQLIGDDQYRMEYTEK